MPRLTPSIFAGVLFLIGGVVTAVVRGPLSSATWFAFGVSFILIQPPLRAPAESRRRLWLNLTHRNVAALIAVAAAVAFLVLQVVRGS